MTPNLFSQTRRALTAGLIALACLPASAATFTNNTSIGLGNTNYDGAAVVVTNCTLTVDGPHAFASVLVAAGGVLTHSFAPGGTISNLLVITNEPQTLSGTNLATLLNSNVIPATVAVTDSTGKTNYVNPVDYLLSSPDGIVTQLQRTTNSGIPDGATVLVNYQALLGTTPAGLNLTVAGNVEVDAGGTISANGNGYGGVLGAGAGRTSSANPADGSGAGYGGSGGLSSSNASGGNAYGSFLQPANLGSGGGAGYAGGGGAGGGLIEIVAGGNLIVNGSISANGANGANSRSGGGSGGSVWLTALTLSGEGSIAANGGGGEPTHGGGGGGGRIALQCNASSYGGTMSAYGGTGANTGGAGTVFTQFPGQDGLVLIDNGGQSGNTTPLAIAAGNIDALIRGNAGVTPTAPWTVGNLTIASNGLLLAGLSTNLSLTSAGAIAIEAGGAMLANAAGSLAGAGSGAGHSYNDGLYRPCGGGGYGGNGAAGSSTNSGGGQTYGVQSAPAGFGSGGGTLTPFSIGGNGGGGIFITSLGGIVQVDGTMAANGGAGSGSGGGGGSGGTISLTGGTLLGSGAITANGGAGANSIGGGGGGGRILIDPAADLFGGAVTAYGGGGANGGGAGTVLSEAPEQNARLILDNGGNAGTNTLVQSAGGTDLIVRGGAIGSASSTVTFADLYVESNGWLTPVFVSAVSPADPVNFTISGNATIAPGGGIIADFAGYPAGAGPGEGRNTTSDSTNYCSGAGHGGSGGNSAGGYAVGGIINDSATAPSSPGSGGGAFLPLSAGGTGGGDIHLTVAGTLEVDGVISANAGYGSGYAGGGSGGSIWLGVGTLAGSGLVSANGGNGAAGLGGGGGGGIIYIPCSSNLFAGTFAAYGGGGANPGGTGPVTVQVTGHNTQLILDAGGRTGPGTPLSSSSTTDVTLRNGAAGLVTSSVTLGNLVIGSNSFLRVSNSFTSSTLTLASAIIQAGGAITGDFQGYAAGTGIDGGFGHEFGTLPSYYCGGAGHGGSGANSFGNLALGGAAYDSPATPILPGSGGGTESPDSVGGAGGCAFRLTVTGLLQIDGTVTSDGGNGSGFGGGGGAGGSINISTGTLSGAGLIAVNGGSGAGAIGGGGGGGCIAIYPTVNVFSGTIAAYGGGGANWGGAGTVYIQPTGQGSQFILNNGGQFGATTPVSPLSLANVIVSNGAIGLATASLSLGNLLVASNGLLLVSNSTTGPTLTFSNATIQAGGGIIADAEGYAAGAGPGAGSNLYMGLPNYPCSGAGHGGRGGNAMTNAAGGGVAYDSTTTPTQSGSGGGTESPSVGGAGGGAFRLIVTGLLQVDGILSANGGNGSGTGGGGGAGGSLYITIGTLAGAGSIAANGGSGVASIGGGGGGGCIALYPTANLFSGLVSAYGGGGANWGGAGTIYIQGSGQNGSQLILNNGGQYGAATPIQSISAASALILSNGAAGYQVSTPQTFASLLVSSNAWLMANPISGASAFGLVNLTLTGNATIQAGGGIVTDNSSSVAGSGQGAGHSYSGSSSFPCSGAGYGGYGANSYGNYAAGGAAYGSVTSPASTGSGGGTLTPDSFGGAGGGSIHLAVTGTLETDGKISAGGGNGSGLGGGGGSGGSIWLTVGVLAGGGSIMANGGAGAEGVGGGGGGGRISIGYATDSFSGPMTAYGGAGSANGGAGTIYTKANSQSVGQLLVANGGVTGANTPLSTALGAPAQAFNLTIGNGAIVSPQTASAAFPLLSNLTVASGGLLTVSSGTSTLDLLVFNNVDVESGGVIGVDGDGYAQGSGPGAGQSYNMDGSGAGYGGVGGASATAPGGAVGGASYGSSNQPASFGSGGGFGFGTPIGGSAGGGALRLSVGGVLTVDGQISAGGQPGVQDNSGGGSGGSLWVTTGTLFGSGLFAANGGAGELYGGGGGAGGRIALYSRANVFSGLAAASGAGGDFAGTAGTVYANTVPPLQILSSSPTGIVSNGVGSIVLSFNGAPNPNSVTAADLSLTTPNGLLSSGSLSVAMAGSTSYLVSFPLQTEVGAYSLVVSSNIIDLYGQPMAQAYTGTFTISLPVIQGVVTDTNGQPIAGVLLQPTGGLSPTTTDTNGNYALGVVPGTSFTVTPSLGALVFVPPSLSYTNISASVSNQNYLAVPTLAPVLSISGDSLHVVLNWQGLAGVNYQIYDSLDLINWFPFGNPVPGTNGPVQWSIATTNGPSLTFFSVQAGD